MSNRYLTFNDMLYADRERPTSCKENAKIDLAEYVRIANGPYNISLYEQTDTENFKVELVESLINVGGKNSSDTTNRSFTVYYETRESDTASYGAWDNVTFTLDGGRMLATLASGDNAYTNELDVSAIYSNSLFAMRFSG